MVKLSSFYADVPYTGFTNYDALQIPTPIHYSHRVNISIKTKMTMKLTRSKKKRDLEPSHCEVKLKQIASKSAFLTCEQTNNKLLHIILRQSAT